MRAPLTLLALVIAAGTAFGQRQKVNINTETPEGQALQQIGQENDEAKKLAHEICLRPPLALKLAKEAILKAFDTSLRDGLDFERKCFYLLFGSEDQREGMKAFLEKRRAEFKGK